MRSKLHLLAAGLALALVACVQTTTTDPTTGAVTTTKKPAPGVLPFAAATIIAYSPRPIIVRQEKSVRITAKEIRERWQPAYGPALP